MWDPRSLTMDRTQAPYTARWIRNHWTTSEVLWIKLLEIFLNTLWVDISTRCSWEWDCCIRFSFNGRHQAFSKMFVPTDLLPMAFENSSCSSPLTIFSLFNCSHSSGFRKQGLYILRDSLLWGYILYCRCNFTHYLSLSCTVGICLLICKWGYYHLPSKPGKQ